MFFSYTLARQLFRSRLLYSEHQVWKLLGALFHNCKYNTKMQSVFWLIIIVLCTKEIIKVISNDSKYYICRVLRKKKFPNR